MRGRAAGDIPPAIVRHGLLLALRTGKAARSALQSNPTCSSLLYELANADGFGDLASHERMLADAVRMDSYAKAIRRHVGPGSVVIDLGTGSGILAILAARQGAKVYAVDHSGFIRVAEQVARHNGIGTITFVQTHSKDFSCPEKVDVILHEQMADCLFGESMVENILDLKHRVLKESGTVLPGRFELYVEPVSLKDESRVPFIHEMCVHGVEFGFLRSETSLDRYRKKAYAFPYLDPGAVDFLLGSPRPVLAVDLNRLTSSNEIPTTFRVSREVTNPGGMDGLCVYFRVLFDDELAFSTAPDEPGTHWRTRLFRTPRREYAAGDVVTYGLVMGSIRDANTWAVSLP